MKNNSPFDDHIKKQFGNYKPEVPSHIWENIMANKEKKRPAGFLFKLRGYKFTILLSLLISTAAVALLVQHFNNNNAVSINAKNNLPGSDQLEKVDNNNAKAEVNSTDHHTMETNIDEATINSSVLNNTDNKQINTVNNKNSQTTTAAEKAVTEHSVYNKSTKKQPGSQQTSQNEAYRFNEIMATDPSKTTVSKNGKNIRGAAGQSKVVIENAGTDEELSVNKNTEETISSVIFNTEAHLTNYYLNLNKEQEQKQISFQIKNINLKSLSIPCPGSVKNSSGNTSYIEIYGGPDYAIRSYSDTANSTYLQKRKESTRVKAAFSVGARYTRVFNNGISFRAGINYSQVNETFNFEQGHFVQIAYIIDANGDTTGSYATSGSRYKTTYNKYRTLDIPLAVGYEMGKGRLRTNINAGIIINVYSWQRGDLLDSAYQPVNITTGKSNSVYQFKTNIGLGFIAGASFYYKLSGKWHFMAEPYFRYNFSSANKADITLKQKFTTVGLRLGLRFDF